MDGSHVQSLAGCTKVSPGCANCYAESLSKRNPKLLGEWGPGKPRVLASEDMWKQPLKWNRQAELAWENWGTAVKARAGYSGPMPLRPRVFCASLADWLDDEVPIAWLARLMELIMRTPHLDWLLLTKRPENWQPRLLAVLATQQIQIFDEPAPKSLSTLGEIIRTWLHGDPPSNVWIGTTVEDATRAHERIPALLQIPARLRFLSCEPLLGHFSLYDALKTCAYWPSKYQHWTEAPYSEVKWEVQQLVPANWENGIHWVICGGESGPKARPMNPDWARSLRDQCNAASVPYFFKQWGAHYPYYKVGTGWVQATPEAREKIRAGEWLGDLSEFMLKEHTQKAGRLLDGREWNEMPRIEGRAS